MVEDHPRYVPLTHREVRHVCPLLNIALDRSLVTMLLGVTWGDRV